MRMRNLPVVTLPGGNDASEIRKEVTAQRRRRGNGKRVVRGAIALLGNDATARDHNCKRKGKWILRIRMLSLQSRWWKHSLSPIELLSDRWVATIVVTGGHGV